MTRDELISYYDKKSGGKIENLGYMEDFHYQYLIEHPDLEYKALADEKLIKYNYEYVSITSDEEKEKDKIVISHVENFNYIGPLTASNVLCINRKDENHVLINIAAQSREYPHPMICGLILGGLALRFTIKENTIDDIKYCDLLDVYILKKNMLLSDGERKQINDIDYYKETMTYYKENKEQILEELKASLLSLENDVSKVCRRKTKKLFFSF